MGWSNQASCNMRRQEIALQQAAAGEYDWAVPLGKVSTDDKRQAAILLTEKAVTALRQGKQTQDTRVLLLQGVATRCRTPPRQMATAYALHSSTATLSVDHVSFGKQGTGGGRYVFDQVSFATAKC